MEAQIRLCGRWFRNGVLHADGGCEVRSFNADTMAEDGVVGDGVDFTQEDVEVALVLLALGGKEFRMEDVYAGLALLDLQAGTDRTLEEYLQMVLPQ